ncbi:hypothetical protein A3D11_04430 [Candidatus Peribacteria bacterium RIFCSPHIGHO2_02_FULL_49_16]|nr:MAG: hypothetical protein A2880_03995 [Candidatus Peribacteria bacterium RIFCSPHIGHO2_01_FULL_49_38]OGJ58949.1 MAG: hypothetical protein A3D11_04430 [Candidatus Peribacteria bacterium RIFCSPHIGHO2_02_FULL_49_16]
MFNDQFSSMLHEHTMNMSFLRNIRNLDIGERMLNSAALVSIIGIFLPWISGQWLGGESIRYSGLHFYTSSIGWSVFVLNTFIFSITAVPLIKNGAWRLQKKDLIRLLCALQSSILLLAALSILTKFTFEFSRLDVRFGIYVALFGSLFVTFESFCKWKEQPAWTIPLPKEPVQDGKKIDNPRKYDVSALPPPPPPPVEEHRIHSFSQHL